MEEEQRTSGWLDKAMEAIEVQKVIVYGLLLVLVLVVGFSWFIASRPVANEEGVKFVLPFFERIGLIVVGVIGGVLVPKKKE